MFTHRSPSPPMFDNAFKFCQNKDNNIVEKKVIILKEKFPKLTFIKASDDSEDWEPREQLLFKSSTIFDDQDRAFKKSNGEWTYFANDAAYHLNKYNRKFDQLINIWGADHVGYIPRMKSVLKTISNSCLLYTSPSPRD